ncbi:hypothetical protein KGF54_004927 [Candida jiufengensis]|uniref:uncharacterized protein n=1 Tax=Candida jiufengensis TaxID=497108 RepID=UPI0022251F06|nr:uncharacterized protein KGF54_004927 [Candida jiufengensis]KAI5951852.1 hypothetical protein KGF54_004927 [Candida jiufengensis]
MIQYSRLKPSKDLASLKHEIKLLKQLLEKQIKTVYFLYKIGLRNLNKVLRLIFYQRSIAFAFLFPYLCEVLPKTFKAVVKSILDLKFNDLPGKILEILKDPLESDRLPIFMIKLIATLNALNPLLLKALLPYVKGKHIQFVSTFLAGVIASLLNFPFFQDVKISQDRFYTFDWTLILIVKAFDTVVTSLASRDSTYFPIPSEYMDVLLAIVSSYLITNSWYFHPEKLNPSYVSWVNKMSVVDREVVEGMRYLNDGSLQYNPQDSEKGSPCHQDHFINYAIKNNKNPELGDLSKHEKLPCEVLHQFRTKSCRKNAMIAFVKQFKRTFKFYAYINLFMYIVVKRFRGNIINILKKTIRSSLFISSLTTIQWCFICFIRNNHPIWKNQKFWDIFSAKIGAAFAGFGILFEYPQRRNDLLIFVTPKALGTFFNMEPTTLNKTLEVIGFSLSFATLVAFARSNPKRLRGLVGKGLSYMVK